jgi:uncharacterized protein
MSITGGDLLPITFSQMLTNLSTWLDKAADQLAGLGQNPDLMLSWQLAPDMYPLSGQIRFACFLAREPHFRLQGLPLPAPLLAVRDAGWSSNEQPGTLVKAKALLAGTIAAFDPGYLAGLATDLNRPLALELPDGHIFDLTDAEYISDWALPQFYFHVNTAYAILRANGVKLGKQDYALQMFKYLRQPTPPAARDRT